MRVLNKFSELIEQLQCEGWKEDIISDIVILRKKYLKTNKRGGTRLMQIITGKMREIEARADYYCACGDGVDNCKECGGFLIEDFSSASKVFCLEIKTPSPPHFEDGVIENYHFCNEDCKNEWMKKQEAKK